jgi:hypothetical protein
MKKIFSSALAAIATTALFAAPTFATRYDISGDYNTVSTPDAVGGMLAASMAVFGVIALIGLAITVFAIVCNWKIFEKAGRKGWEAIIPIYNMYVMTQIAGLQSWYIILLIIPFVNFVASVYLIYKFVKSFGQGIGFCIGYIFLPIIFVAIMAFDKKITYINNVPPVPGATPTPVATTPADPWVNGNTDRASHSSAGRTCSRWDSSSTRGSSNPSNPSSPSNPSHSNSARGSANRPE